MNTLINYGRSVLCGLTMVTGALAAPPPGYRLAWQDEFDGTTLDEEKWQYRTDVRFWSAQLPENVSVADGLLKLHLRKETVSGVDYTAGGVISRELFRYGYYEARLKVPPGSGWHTAFWMMKYNRLPTDDVSIELDVIENDSVTPLQYYVNIHRHLPTPHTQIGTKYIDTPSLSENFHVFGCEFTPTTVRYFFNGALVQTVNTTQLPTNDMNIWLTSIAAPLGGTTSVDDSQLPAVALFDYVRYYEPFPVPTVRISSPAEPAVTVADASATLRLSAEASSPDDPPAVEWSMIEGPAAVLFSTPQSLETRVSFSAPGSYVLQCTATNEGGAATDHIHIGVDAPTTRFLRESTGDNYEHTATIIRGDYPAWNAGARNQLIVGRTSAPIRTVFSFSLSDLGEDAVIHDVALDLRSQGGLGSVGKLQLRSLSATPIEGTGISESSESNLGTGTGTTWITRTGGSAASDLWTNPGGDFTATVLSETPGFDATISGLAVTLPSTTALTAAANQSYSASAPLDLILSSDNEATTSAYVRLASDDATVEADRPALRVVFSGMRLPTVDTGLVPSPESGLAASLAGSTTDATATLWEQVSGPGTVVFDDAALATTNAIFPKAGIYQLRLVATNSLGTVERLIDVTVAGNPAIFDDWQQIEWPGVNDPSITGPGADPDQDGYNNLLEWALAMRPQHSDTFTPELTADSSSTLTYTYTRRKIVPGQATFHVEWSDTLAAGDWSEINVVPSPPVSIGDTVESVTCAIPPGPENRRFIRLRVESQITP